MFILPLFSIESVAQPVVLRMIYSEKEIQLTPSFFLSASVITKVFKQFRDNEVMMVKSARFMNSTAAELLKIENTKVSSQEDQESDLIIGAPLITGNK